jgi:uncharacterized protein YlxW (UPF0749 family)
MNEVLLLLAGVATFIMGCLAAYYKRLSAHEEAERAKLKDSLQLIDTRTKLRESQKSIDQLEKERLDAQAKYDSMRNRNID